MKAKKHLDKCTEKECKYNTSNTCMYGLRNRLGCYLDSEMIHDIKQQELLILDREQMAMKYTLKEHEHDLIGKLTKKQYEFICCNHHFTIKDSARNQGECPHCGKRSITNFYEFTDEEFIGYKVIDKHQTVLCFECKGCFGKFFYHVDTDGDIIERLKKYTRIPKLKW